MREFADLLSIPNLASDNSNIRRNADALVAMLEQRGVAARLLELEGSPPAVLGEITEAVIIGGIVLMSGVILTEFVLFPGKYKG